MADPNIMNDFVGPSIAAALLAMVSGAAGGVVGDLLLPYRGRLGRLRRWGWYPADRVARDGTVTVVPKTHFDLGWASSAFVGLVAALIVLPLYPAEVGVLQATATRLSFYGLKVIAFSALIGVAGGAIITGLHDRALKLLDIKTDAAATVNRVAKTSKAGVVAIREALAANASANSVEVQKQIEQTLEAIDEARNSSLNGNPSESSF